MGVLNWGGPKKVEIGKLGANDAAPSTWIELDIPVEDSVQLTTNDGDTQEARGEGGVIVDFKKKKNTYEFAFELFKKKNKAWPVEDIDGVVDGFYAMRLTPEDSDLDGIQFAKSVITAGDTYNTADGQRKPYVMHVINATSGKTILPYTAPSVTYSAVAEPTGNPSTIGYYERSGASGSYVYQLSRDTEVDSQKTYYARS